MTIFLTPYCEIFQIYKKLKKLIMNICISCAKILRLNFQKFTFEVSYIAYVFIHSLVHLVCSFRINCGCQCTSPYLFQHVYCQYLFTVFFFFRWNLHIQDEQIYIYKMNKFEVYHSLHSDRHIHMIASWSHYFIFSKAYIWGRCH